MAAVIGCWSPPDIRADQAGVEYKVKAAFLLNFARFVTWPAATQTSGPFSLCIVGNDPFGDALTGIEAKKVGEQNVQLRFPAADSKELGQCRMLFVSKSEAKNIAKIFKMVDGKPVVTVSDVPGFSDAGGIFEFKDLRGRLSFIINNSQAKSGGLNISSSLLNLAVDVL